MSTRIYAMALIAVTFLTLAGCGVVVRSGPLSGRPDAEKGVYLSTGGAPRPFKTLGFIQIRGYGVNIAGLQDVGDAALDGTVRGRMAQEAAKMGGDGVINIEFVDENPQTLYERAAAASSSFSADPKTGRTQIQTKDRYVTVTGEVVQFVER